MSEPDYIMFLYFIYVIPALKFTFYVVDKKITYSKMSVLFKFAFFFFVPMFILRKVLARLVKARMRPNLETLQDVVEVTATEKKEINESFFARK